MKISTNSFGNYKPIIPKKTINPSAETKNTKDIINVTNEEKTFFTKLYPDQKEQIDQYHFYSKEGNKNGVAIGSLFDKRG